MTPLQALEASIATLQTVIGTAPITEDELRAPTPCADFTVDQLGEHVIDTHNLLLGAAGGEARSGEGSLSDRHAAVGAASVAVWARRGTDGTIDVGGDELPAAFGLSLHTLEAYVHAWDLAQALRRAFDPPAELTSHAWEIARGLISDDLRGEGAGAPYGPAVAAAEDDDLVARLMAHTGRDPRNPIGLAPSAAVAAGPRSGEFPR